MASQGPSQAPKQAGGGRQATIFLNPERVPMLLPKWQKLIGTDLEKVSVEWKADGVTVELYGMPGTVFHKKDSDGDSDPITIADYQRLRAEKNRPSKEDAKFAFRNKFEVRLDQAFPESCDLGDGSEESLRKAVQSLPFNQRRVMLMSNKQFKTAYPNGFAAGSTPAA
jgi:hypothetical protein